MNRRSVALLGTALLSAMGVAGAEVSPPPAAFKVVVHPDNPAARVAPSELSAIFLGRKTAWSDGTKAVPIDQGESSPVREAFSMAVHGRKPSAVRSYWMQVLFSGRGVPPVEKSGDDAVLADVRVHRGAVGYVSAAARTDGVKVLQVRP